MDVEAIPTPLRERLGHDGSAGLLSLLDRVRRNWSREVIAVCAERFDRRLVEEMASLRIEMAQGHATLRTQMAEGDSSLRAEIATTRSALRAEIATTASTLRAEIATTASTLREEIGRSTATLRQEIGAVESRLTQQIAASRVDLIKWSFVFWMGQVVAVAGMLTVMLRLLRP